LILKARLVLATFILSAQVAQAEAIKSTYSDFDLTKCKTVSVSQEDGGGTWKCEGISGYDVTYSEGDLRGTMAFSPSVDIQCAAAQSFGHFNSPGAKIEWRIKNGKPIATILRWYADGGEPSVKQDWLVVTKLNGDEACRTAIIGAQYPNANVVARQKADISIHFDCTKVLP
jgi:hypothetical protein